MVKKINSFVSVLFSLSFYCNPSLLLRLFLCTYRWCSGYRDLFVTHIRFHAPGHRWNRIANHILMVRWASSLVRASSCVPLSISDFSSLIIYRFKSACKWTIKIQPNGSFNFVLASCGEQQRATFSAISIWSVKSLFNTNNNKKTRTNRKLIRRFVWPKTKAAISSSVSR